jgi:hypothetical protein
VTINPHIMKLVAAEKAADLRRDVVAPRPEATAKPAPAQRRPIQVAGRRRPAATPQLEDR